jgi:hypothetical protein
MPDEVTPQRVQALAAAARVALEPASAARVARTVAPVVARLSSDPIELPFEAEPATFPLIQRQDRSR